MPSLQVRELPEDVYNRLQARANAEHRSIAQETIVLLRDALGMTESRQEERRAIIERMRGRGVTIPSDAPPPGELVREDRDR